MPNTKITKNRLKTHWLYSSWKYILMIVLFIAGWSLTYSVTEYKPPREKRLEMFFLAEGYSDEKIRALADEFAPDFMPEMEEVNFFTMSYGGDDDVYGPQVLMTRLATAEGDVYMVDENVFTSFINQELAMPLDEYVESGAISLEGQNLDVIQRARQYEDDDGNIVIDTEKHIYGLQAEQLYRFVDEGLIDNRGKYIVIMNYTDKPDVAIELINELFEKMTIPKPDWISQREAEVRQQLEQLPKSLTADTPAT